MLAVATRSVELVFQPQRLRQKGYRALLLALAMLFGMSCAIGPQNAASARAASSASAAQSIYFGLVYPGAPDVGLLQHYEAELQHGMSLVLWYQDWAMAGKQQAFPVAHLDMARQHGSIPVLAWYPMDGTAPSPNQPAFTLTRIINGSWDAYIRQYATQVKNWGHPFFLRFASEMNGSWIPWSEMSNGNQAGQFVRAWRHVHDIFTQVGVKNATWTWCPNVEDSTTTPLEDLYPGSAYVDWACMDGYNFSVDLKVPWRSFSQIFGGTYRHLQALTPASMPIMIGEMGSVEHGGSKAGWITDALAHQIPANYPRIKGVIWFQSTNPGLDLRFDTSPQSLKAMSGALGSGAYASNTFRFLDQSPIPAPGDVTTQQSSPPVFHDVNSPPAGYVQVLDASRYAPIPGARLFYDDDALATTDDQGLAAMPGNATQLTLQAIGVSGGMMAIREPLDRHEGYQIQIDMTRGEVISIRVHDPTPLREADPPSAAFSAFSALKTAPRSLLATIGLAALTLLFALLLVTRLGIGAWRRRTRMNHKHKRMAPKQRTRARQAAQHGGLRAGRDTG